MVFKLRTAGRHRGMGTGWVSPKAPTQTDFFFFFYARIRVENGGSFSCSEAKNGNKKNFKFPSSFLWQTNFVWTLTLVIKQTNLNILNILQMIK